MGVPCFVAGSMVSGFGLRVLCLRLYGSSSKTTGESELGAIHGFLYTPISSRSCSELSTDIRPHELQQLFRVWKMKEVCTRALDQINEI